MPLKARSQEVIDAHKKLQTKAEAELRYSGIKIAGYLIQIPSVSSTRIDQDKLIGKKSECFCGSGRQYKDCCQIIESYSENDVSFDSELWLIFCNNFAFCWAGVHKIDFPMFVKPNNVDLFIPPG